MMRDMTKGAPLGHLFLYAVPLLLGNWLQLAYNAVDSIIAGRFIGRMPWPPRAWPGRS